MVIGVPKETYHHEHRVGLTPLLVRRLAGMGHTVFVERDAGEAAHFTDEQYAEAGARTAYSSEEIYQRADLVCRVGYLSVEEMDYIRSGSTICAFHHMAVMPEEKVQRLVDLQATIIGYEVIRGRGDELPVLIPFSEMAGHMVIVLAGWYLQAETGGRGILIGNVPGVPPPTVLILGAGTVGRAAARDALAIGAHVVVLDDSLEKLRTMSNHLPGPVVTAIATPARLSYYSAIADVVVGAVLIPGERSPFLISEVMVKGMKPGSVIIDVSIDQGGCVETSRPTTLDNPTFKTHGVIHYCVPNMTANIPRTASRALSNAALPYIQAIAGKGLEAALKEDAGLASGVYMYRGKRVPRGTEGAESPVAALYGMMEGD